MKMADILDQILPEVAGCPSNTARIAVLRATQELCRVSGIWREWLEPIALVDDQFDYALEPSDAGFIETVKEVWVGSREIFPISHADLAWKMPDWRTARSTSPVYFNLDAPRDVLHVFPATKDSTESLRVKVVLMPAMTDKAVDDSVWKFYGEAIEKGAKARLMMQRGTQWFEPKLGEMFGKEFGHAVAAARIDEEAGQTVSTTVVRPRRFG